MQRCARILHFRTASLSISVISACLVLTPRVQAVDNPVTVETLLRKMSDPRWLAMPPEPGERTVQFSSYDRATRLEGGKIVNPFANGDVGQYLRVDGKGDRQEWVLAESQGPGYVSRIWSANPNGELRIYIDGNPTPALAAPFPAITNGEIAPFGAPFGHDASRGRNLYFPFPFAKSIKITTTKGKQYFQVSVTSLPAGTNVESYSEDVLKRAAPVLEETRRGLLQGGLHRASGRSSLELQKHVVIPAGGSSDLVDQVAPGKDTGGAITRLMCKVDAADREDALAHAPGDHLRWSRTAAGCRSPGRFLWIRTRGQRVRVVDEPGSK